MASVAGSWCPFRQPQIAGTKVPCDDSCALYIATSKLPPTHSCALTAMGILAIQKIVVPDGIREPDQDGAAETDRGI